MPPGRIPLLTDDTERRILDALTVGATVKDAAAAAGISVDTLGLWLRNGRKARDQDNPDDRGQLYLRFLQNVEQARGAALVAAVATIRRAITGWDETTTITKQTLNRDGEIVTLTETRTVRKYSWNAAAWWMERSRPAEWGRFMRLDDSESDAEVLDVDALRERAEALVRDELARKREQHAASPNGETAAPGV